MEIISFFLDIMDKVGVDISDAIIGFAIATLLFRHDSILKKIINKHDTKLKKMKHISEEYTMETSETINNRLESIVMSDQRISSAILCNYHNSVSSNVDLSYYYFTSITEAIGMNSIDQCIDIWKEKSYMNFQKELKMIHRSNCVTVNINTKEDVTVYPKMAKLIQDSNMKTCMFIPINIISKPIGFIILLFKDDIIINSKAEFLYKLKEEIDDIGIMINYSRHE